VYLENKILQEITFNEQGQRYRSLQTSPRD